MVAYRGPNATLLCRLKGPCQFEDDSRKFQERPVINVTLEVKRCASAKGF